MKLTKRKMLLVSFMLFSLFFGAGNLIFPPFLGQNAGSNTSIAMLGFLITAVILPVFGVIVVAKFNGLDRLSKNIGDKFAIVFTLLIYISIGPLLGIPRAASVPFEMAIAPYLPEGAKISLWMFTYSLLFFLVALWFCLTPGKLVDRIGNYLTPSLLILLFFLFISFLVKGKTAIALPQAAYQSNAFLQGFSDGYQTMDAIAALNFGLVIAITLKNLGLNKHKDVMSHTIIAGLLAGIILALVYAMLSYMGEASSGIYALQDNGALVLRNIVLQVFGLKGAILLAMIFTLACLTTCIGLINSVSQYLSTLCKKINYKTWVYIIISFSFIICNQGLTTILSISIPILNAIYPASIMLILLGLSHKLWKNNKYVYPLVIYSVFIVSIISSLKDIGLDLGIATRLLNKLPLSSYGYGWVIIALVSLTLSVVIKILHRK